MKKTLAALLAVVLACSLLAGCGVKEKIEQKVTEKIVETVVEEAIGGGNTDIDISEGNITIKDEKGGSFTFGTAEWPDVDYLPEFKGGSIITVTNDSEGNLMVMFENVDQDAFGDYLAGIKEAFPAETVEVQNQDYYYYEGKNSKGEQCLIQYYMNEKALTIFGKSNREL